MLKKGEKNEKIGNDCLKYMGIINLKYPSVHGMFSDINDIVQIFEYYLFKFRYKYGRNKRVSCFNHRTFIKSERKSTKNYKNFI